MLEVYVTSFQHIDFWVEPSTPAAKLIEEGQLPCTEAQAAEAFKKSGWEGDGHISYIWIPPFMLNYETYGLCIWHVKQSNDGTSWLCSETPFESPGFDAIGHKWKKVELIAPARKSELPF